MFENFIEKYLGKKVDVDGYYGAQCVDLFNAWNRDYNNTYINCSPSGYARSIAENKNNNGMLKYFDEVKLDQMTPGTVVVYGNCPFAPLSHVCFFIKDNGNNTFQALQQNNNGRDYVTIDSNPYDGIIGAFTPKQIYGKKYVNLSNKADTWRFYRLNDAPVKKNAIGFLKPSKFGGLSYTILGYADNDTTAVINTRQFGEVKIYIKHRLCSITDKPVYDLIS